MRSPINRKVRLGDIGDHRFESEIRRLSADRDPEVAQASKDALRILAAQR